MTVETLPATHGRFRLNAELPIPFDEHGYFIVRCLASDLGKRLDEILDAILRATEHCIRKKGSRL